MYIHRYRIKHLRYRYTCTWPRILNNFRERLMVWLWVWLTFWTFLWNTLIYAIYIYKYWFKIKPVVSKNVELKTKTNQIKYVKYYIVYPLSKQKETLQKYSSNNASIKRPLQNHTHLNIDFFKIWNVESFWFVNIKPCKFTLCDWLSLIMLRCHKYLLMCSAILHYISKLRR